MERRLWISLYVFGFLAPLAVLAVGPAKHADKLTLFAICMGFLTYTGAVLQTITPSRAPQFSDSVGMPLLLRLHRYMGMVVVALLIMHVTALIIRDSQFISWLFPVGEKMSARMGWLAGVALLLIAATSLWRKLFRLKYEVWRLVHLGFAAVIIVAGFLHAILSAWYTTVGSLRWMTIGAAAVGVFALVYLRFGRSIVALGSPYAISEIINERGDSTTLQLTAVGHGGTTFRPGQFAWIKVSGRPFALTEHPFSYASSAADPANPAFTIKRSGDATNAIPYLQPGHRVYVDGPHGAYEPVLPTSGFVLTVGGIGITPAMSFIRTYADIGDSRPIRLIVAARTYEDVTFREELDELQTRMPLEIVYVINDPPPGWTGLSGRLNPELLSAALPADAAARNHFICGPPPMVEMVIEALHDLGVPDELVYADLFDSV